jgi:hypothetical protein
MSFETETPYVFSPHLYSEFKYRIRNWIVHNFHRNSLVGQVIEGKIKEGIEVTGRRGRKCRNLLDDLIGKDTHF